MVFTVYRNYLHGWDEKHNKELDMMDDHLIELRPREVMTTPGNREVINGFENDERRINDLVSEYQAFLNPIDQSETYDFDLSQEELDHDTDTTDASMVPMTGNTVAPINPSLLENSSNEVWEPSLEVPPSPASRTTLEFELGVQATSTQRSRAGRTITKHNYKKVNEEGF